MIEKLFREDLSEFKPYDVGKTDYKIRLDANESYFIGNVKLKNEISEAIYNVMLNRYPDGGCSDVCKSYSEYIGVPKENIIAGNGSDELIQIIVNAFINEGDLVLKLNPDFSMYEIYTKIRGGKIEQFTLEKEFTLCEEKLIKRANESGCKLLFLSNPNNPTGLSLKSDRVLKIVSKCKCIVVIDEAYMEFFEDSVVKEISRYENLIVLRTASKALSAAAIRLGFLLANFKLLNEIKKVKPPFNVSTLTQAVGNVILKNKEIIKENVKFILLERDYLITGLTKIKGIKVYPTSANFVLIKCENCGELNEELLKGGIKVRNFKDKELINCLRICAGNREENETLIYEIEKFMER